MGKVQEEWTVLLLAWLLLAGPSGAVMYVVTEFLFAFSGERSQVMGPLVRAGPWIVGLGALLAGGIVLMSTGSLARAAGTILGSIVGAWLVVVVVLWVVSDWRGLQPPRFGF